MAAQATNEILTPSEAVLLFGDRFCKKSMLGEKLLLADHKVGLSDLAEKMMTAAILGNLARGFVTLTIEHGKALFGLMKTQKLKIAPTGKTADWPEHTSESALLRTLGSSTMDVDDLVIAYIGGISASPEGDYLSRVKAGLSQRGLISAEVKKLLGMSVGTNVSLTAAQRAQIEENGPASAQALLADAEKTQKEIFEKVKNAVSAAFTNRTQSE